MKPRLGGVLLGAFLIVTAIPAALAQDPALSLAVGNATRLVVKRAFETVMIGDPLVIDVRVDDNRSITIDPLSPGVTNVVLVDTNGIVTANIRVVVCAASSNACEGRSASLAIQRSIRQDS